MTYACKDCAERTVGCHASCERYIQSRNENRQKRKWLGNMNRVCVKPTTARYEKSSGKYVFPKKGVGIR